MSGCLDTICCTEMQEGEVLNLSRDFNLPHSNFFQDFKSPYQVNSVGGARMSEDVGCDVSSSLAVEFSLFLFKLPE